MLLPGTELDLTVGKPVAGGWTLARHEGQVVLVGGAIPGERVRARIVRVDRDVAYATVAAVIEPDRDRRPVVGDPACGGNAYAHIAYDRQLEVKSAVIADALARIARVTRDAPVAVAPSPERGYRMRARLHVRGGRVGFFREGTHELCDATTTGQLLLATEAVIEQLSAELRARHLTGITALELAENVAADQRVLHLELDRDDAGARAGLAALGRLAGVGGVTAFVPGHVQPVLIAGVPYVTDPVAAIAPALAGASDAILRRQAAAFFQGNRFLLPALVSRVLEAVDAEDATDLYAGVGLFAVALAAAGQRVTAVEADPVSTSDLRANAIPFGDAMQVRHGSVERYLREVRRPPPATAIVDPPRGGLSREAVAGVIAWRPPRLVYVSCDVATFARDLRRLVDGGYRLTSLEAFDLFPNTAHVELLGIFDVERGTGELNH